jgi:integrase
VKERKRQQQAEETAKSRWQKSPHRGIVRYVPSGIYFARVRIKGKLIVRSLKTDALTVAVLRLSDLEKQEREQAESGNRVVRGKVLFSDAQKQFEERVEANPRLKPRTKDYYVQRLEALHRSWPGLDKREVRTLTQAECVAWAGRFQKETAATAYNHTIGVLRQVFEVAVESGARYNNPAARLPRAREKRKELSLPTADQFNAIVRHIARSGAPHCHESADVVMLLATTGLRKMEAANLTWADVDFDKGQIIVRGDPTTGTKNNEVRRVPMIPDARSLLLRMQFKNFKGDPAGKVARVIDVRKSLDNACKAIGIKPIVNHDLRHLFCTRCLETGVPVHTVAAWAGHKDGGALLLRTYSHLRADHSAAMAQRVTFTTTPSPAPNITPMPEAKEASA